MKRAIITAAIVLMLAGAAWGGDCYILKEGKKNPVGEWDTVFIGLTNPTMVKVPCPDDQEKPCRTEKKTIPLSAYQGYMDNHRYEWEAVDEVVGKHTGWIVEYIHWEGNPIDPNYYSIRHGYIILRRCVEGE